MCACRHINEDKRRAEGHQTLFSIVNDIENCPVSHTLPLYYHTVQQCSVISALSIYVLAVLVIGVFVVFLALVVNVQAQNTLTSQS